MQVYDRPNTGPATPSANRDRGQRSASEDRGNTSTPQPQPNISSLPLPAMSPESTANYYAQLASLSSGLTVALAASKAQRVGIKAQGKVAAAQIRSDAIDNMASTVNHALDTGTVGASFDAANRVGVLADRASGLAANRADVRGQLAQSRLGDQATALQYQLSGQQLEGQRIAEIDSALRDQLLNNTIISGMESQVDALKAVYEALAQNAPGGNQPGRGPRGSGSLGTVFAAPLTAVGTSIQQLLANQATQAAVPPSTYPGLNDAGMNPMANGRKR